MLVRTENSSIDGRRNATRTADRLQPVCSRGGFHIPVIPPAYGSITLIVRRFFGHPCQRVPDPLPELDRSFTKWIRPASAGKHLGAVAVVDREHTETIVDVDL